MATRTALLTFTLLCAPFAHAEDDAPERAELSVEYLAHSVINPKHHGLQPGSNLGGLSGVHFPMSWSSAHERMDFTFDATGRVGIEFVSDSLDRTVSHHATLWLRRISGKHQVQVYFGGFAPLDVPDMTAYERLRAELDDRERARTSGPLATDAESIDSAGGVTAFAFERPHQVVVDISRTLPNPKVPPRDPPETLIELDVPQVIARRIRDNRGFESVVITAEPDDAPPYDRFYFQEMGYTVWAATESAITTDGDEATTESGTLCTLLRWDRFDALPERLLYRTDPMPAHAGPTFALHSLTELEALPDGRLLALERSLTFPAGYGAKLFVIDPKMPGETHTDGRRIVHKELLADLSQLTADVDHFSLGNLEGMALGPEISRLTSAPNAEGRLLLLVADDNFGDPLQRHGSLVLALRLTGLNGD